MMNKLIYLFLALFLFPVLASSQNREVIWSDEFNYEGLPDTAKWGYDVGGNGWGNNELQYYADARLENSRVENGNLIIEAHYEFFSGKAYSSARLITKNKGDWQYGYFEMRAKLPSGRGTWPAFWMLPTDWEYGGWPGSGEIDIMEHVGYDTENVHGTVHTKSYNHIIGTQVGVAKPVPDCEEAFHVYACEWTADYIKMYIDDELYFTFENQGNWQAWPFDKRFHILVNLAVGGNWGGVEGVDSDAFPTQFVIDYIRVYAPGTTPNAIPEKETDKTIKVYPNPAQEKLFIDSSEHNGPEALEFSLYNSLGKLVLKRSIQEKLVSLNISELKGGMYYYQISSGNENLDKGRFIKQ
ncbi:family 16 glycosylhydrolase [Lentimicrobium sp. S6]|uniref:family 16 glycosylhydrolase n=1 Tax=Lentimicrobium sp. S6 TaxID=2735872 RepID=UPI00155283ED|nr:family 16 glycosylhydrolase [Lentimicrobium sp. S6]NPD47315.1 family 16 glycosylhydrolase [Lentimicrobium sp. S6]